MKKIIASLFLMAAYQVGFAGGYEAIDSNYYEWYMYYNSSGNSDVILGNVQGSIPSSVTTVSIPSQVANIDGGTVRTVTQLGDGNTIIYDQPAFFGVIIPSTIQLINSYAFANLQNLTSVVINGSPDIQSNAFSNDPNLTDVPSVCGDIGDSAFEGCTNLRNVGLKDGVTKIGKRAFANCKNLKSLTIPRTVISIEPDAFVGSGLKQVTVNRGQLVQYPKLPKGAFVRVRETAP
jgi:hypothetical protein